VGNPLVAETKSSTQGFSGIPLLESANDLKSAIESGDWASVAMGAVGTALDALSMAMDPFGSILAAGVGWLMEHVGPLKQALDALAGNPDEVKAQAETWKNVAKELGDVGTELVAMVKADTGSWKGEAGDNYRKRADDTATLITAAQKGAEGAGSGVQTAGEVVAAVRTLVRDIIAELVGHLVSWALQVVFTLGIGLTWVVPQVVAAVAKTASKIAGLTQKLVKALKALMPLLKRADDLFADAAKSLKKLTPGSTKSAKKTDIDEGTSASNAKGPGGGSQSGNGGGTGPSSTHGSPDPTPNGPPPVTKGPDNGSTNPSGSSGSPNKPNPPRKGAVETKNKKCKTDPVDVATGDVLLVQRDLTLPHTLDLILERTHTSSYRAGLWFGTTWASTLDQRLELDDEHAVWFSPDGMRLVYPLPGPGAATLPLEGPRRPLLRTGRGYRLTDPKTGTSLVFAPLPGRGGAVLPLIRTEGSGGDTIDVEYDDLGAPLLLRHSVGYLVEFTSADGRVTEVRVADQDTGSRVVVVRYRYDRLGRLTGIVDSTGLPQQFDYDGVGRMTGWQDRNGVWYRYIYDTAGRCVRTVGDRGFYDGAFTYDSERLVTAFTDSLGHTSELRINPADQLLSERDPLGNVTAYTWDRYDRQLSRTDPLGRTTRYEYDELGELTVVIRPDGSRVHTTRHPDGALDIEVEADGRVWRRTYPAGTAPDPMNAQLGVSGETPEAESGTTPAGAPGGTGSPGGEPAADSRAELDLFGRPHTVVNAAGGHTRLAWNVEGKMLSRTGPSGAREQWRYDNEGNEIGHVRALGQSATTEYGTFDLITATVDGTGARTTYGYDTELRLVAVTNPNGQTWRYVHDAAGRVVEEIDFDGRITRYEHDAAGQLVRSVNGAGETVEYGYDVLGNVVWRRTPTEVATFAYDPVGRLVTAANPDATVSVERDDRGRVVSHTVNGRTLGFRYDDETGTLARRTPSGVDSVWRHADDGEPAALEMGGHEVTFDHDSGVEVRRQVDGGPVLAQAYDQEQRLTEQVTTIGGQEIGRRRFEYRPDGVLAAVEDGTGAVRFQLDAEDRITEVSGPGRLEHYGYDGCGNIVTAGSDQRQYQGTRLLGTSTAAYEYDGQGRLIVRRVRDLTGRELVWRFTWNALDRLTSATTPDGSLWVYRYDPMGRRIAKQRLVSPAPGAPPVIAEEVTFVWDGTMIVEQWSGDEVTTWEHHPEDDRPVAQFDRSRDAARFATVITDRVGSPLELIDADGRPVWQDQSTLWGAGGVAAGTPLRFPGQFHDAETGLHYNVYRYYDPETGRYLSPDPLGLEPAPNPVTYVPNPLEMSDPLGLVCANGNGGGTRGIGGRKNGKNDKTNASGSKAKRSRIFRPGNIVNKNLKDPAVDAYKKFKGKIGKNGKPGKKDTKGKTKKDRSEDMGEAGALDYIKKTTGKDDLKLHTPSEANPLSKTDYTTAQGKPWPNAVKFNHSGVVDVAYFDGNKLHVIEAKGGKSELVGGPMKGRTQWFDPDTGVMRPIPDRTNNPNKMDQGSSEYLTDIAHAMRNSPQKDGRNLIGDLVWNGQKTGIVDYVPIGTKINGSGNAVVSVIKQ